MFPGSPSLPGPGLSAAYPCTIIPIRYSYKIHSLHTIIGSVISGARKLKGAKKACVWARVHPASDMDKKEANFPVLVSPFFFPAAGGGGPTTCGCSDGAARQVDRGRGRRRVEREARGLYSIRDVCTNLILLSRCSQWSLYCSSTSLTVVTSRKACQ